LYSSYSNSVMMGTENWTFVFTTELSQTTRQDLKKKIYCFLLSLIEEYFLLRIART